MKKTYTMPIFALALISCEGGGGESDAMPTNTPSTFPNVAGRYSFNTNQVTMSCSDGAVATNPPIAFNFDVIQSVNEITLVNTDAGSMPGITVIDSTQATGNVEPDSSFIVTQMATANIDGITGAVNLSFNITGDFIDSGWTGVYIYTVSSVSLGSCTFSTTFSGTKIVAVSVGEMPKMIYEANALIDIYDQFGAIGSSLAAGK